MGVITAAGYLVGLIGRDREAYTRIYASSCPGAVCMTCRCSRCGAGSSSPVTWRSRRGSSDDRATAVKHRRLLPVGGGGGCHQPLAGGELRRSRSGPRSPSWMAPTCSPCWRTESRGRGVSQVSAGMRPVPAIRLPRLADSRRRIRLRATLRHPSPLNTSRRAEGGLSGQMPRTRTLAGTRTCCWTRLYRLTSGRSRSLRETATA